jgi:hypothetical protein
VTTDGDGGSRHDRTPHEDAFLTVLLDRVAGLDVWLHEDPDGTPWLTVSHDFVSVPGRGIERVARLDYDGGGRLRGGWSPADLNWDDGVRADDAGVATDPPDGLHAEERDPVAAAALAADWFRRIGL